MNQNSDIIPPARNWREISQSVKPRAMSRGGRLRLVMSGVRAASVAAVLGGLAWGVWVVAGALGADPRNVPAAARAVPMKAPDLVTTRDGVLDHEWLVRTLELRPGVSLLELDLGRLRARLLADRQVLTAELTRVFPDRLRVRISERMPIARIRIVDLSGVQRDLVAARDGVAYLGTGYDPAMLNSLPWLDGVRLAPDGLAYRALAEFEPVGRLLSDAQFWAPHLYTTWHTLSLARLAADREIEVVTKNGTVANFSAKDELLREFIPQLAKLDYISDKLSRLPPARVRIDLSLGREVPVMIEPLETPRPLRPGARPNPNSFLSTFSVSLSKTKS